MPGASGGSSAAPSAAATAAPGSSGGTGAAGVSTENRQPARDELWIPIVLVALAILTVEWLVYQRDAVTRLWRGVRRREAAPEGRRG